MNRFFIFSLDQPFQKAAKRTEQSQTQHHISDTMRNIISNPCYPVCEGSRRAADEKIGDCTQGTERNSVKTGENTPEYYGLLFSEQPGHHTLNAPDIEIIHPPKSESVKDAFQEDKHIDH